MGSFDKSKLKSASFINRSSGRRKEITDTKKSAKAIFESPPEKEKEKDKEKEKGGTDNLSDTYSMSHLTHLTHLTHLSCVQLAYIFRKRHFSREIKEKKSIKNSGFIF